MTLFVGVMPEESTTMLGWAEREWVNLATVERVQVIEGMDGGVSTLIAYVGSAQYRLMQGHPMQLVAWWTEQMNYAEQIARGERVRRRG